jgi:hypothetical protein
MEEAFMKRLAFAAVTAGAVIGAAGAASAQTFYFGFSADPYPPPPPPYYAPPPQYYGPPPGPAPAPPYYGSYRYYPDYDAPAPRYYRYGPQYGERGYYYPPGRYRTWNGCQPGWTVQDGLCKPYRGY